MVLRNSMLVRARDMDKEQKEEMGIDKDAEGLIAMESHNEKYERKAVLLKKGLVHYILNGE